MLPTTENIDAFHRLCKLLSEALPEKLAIEIADKLGYPGLELSKAQKDTLAIWGIFTPNITPSQTKFQKLITNKLTDPSFFQEKSVFDELWKSVFSIFEYSISEDEERSDFLRNLITTKEYDNGTPSSLVLLNEGLIRLHEPWFDEYRNPTIGDKSCEGIFLGCGTNGFEDGSKENGWYRQLWAFKRLPTRWIQDLRDNKYHDMEKSQFILEVLFTPWENELY